MNDNNNYYIYLKNNIKKYKINDDYIISELLIEIFNYMKNYIEENILQIIYEDIFIDLYEITKNDFINEYDIINILNILYNYDDKISNKILSIHINIARNFIYKYIIPKRSYIDTFIRNKNRNKDKILNIIEILKLIKQPEQKTDNWYIFRNSTLTASNIYKIFITDYTQTQLILEKCEPLDLNKFKTNDENSPLHWGQKYEPVSIMYYEYINKTNVTEFGCIKHPLYEFIAASPDGIVCDINSKLFGRMLEIKNVVSREITGIPKMEYWIQMQIQMEVCNLNECDFLETKFTEYSTYDLYKEDNPLYKGILLQFKGENGYIYEYCPLGIVDITSDEYNIWEDKIMLKNIHNLFIRNIYWKLEKISCVLVLRNKLWFDEIQPLIESFWKKLLYEKETGLYKERIRKKSKMEVEHIKNNEGLKKGCLIDLNNIEYKENDEYKKKEPIEINLNIDTEIYK